MEVEHDTRDGRELNFEATRLRMASIYVRDRIQRKPHPRGLTQKPGMDQPVYY
jgi:hypothetical protein